MADRFKYSEVRQKIIDAIRTDLIGPREKEEVLEENPRYAYLVGMLDIQSDDEDYSGAGEQEVDADMAFEDGEDFTAGEDDDNEPISTTHFQLPSSIGISFYIQSDTESINLDVTWGDYVKSSEKYTGKDEKEHSRAIYTRQPMEETVRVQFKDFTRTKDYQLVCDSNVHVHVSRIPLKGGYSLVTAYVINKRKNPANSAEAIMFQVEIKAYAEDGSALFMCIHDGIKPKYVVSTATIKNAEAQTRCLYARKNTTQFPPNGFEIGDSFFIREISVDDDPFRKYVGVCAPGQSVKTALLRVYAIILQAAYTYSLQDEYKDVIDPYYSLVGYFNSIRELGGAVRLLQDDIPKRIYRIKNKYGLDKQRYLNHNVEITSRMSSYKIPEKLNQLETTCASKDCLDTAIATNMIAVGMDVDRLGLMVVTGQPKQNSEYIQATSRIGRAFPGLVVTLYNAYRPRDLSHYENFTGYHSQLYRFVEGTTATPFSARARDRVMHALIISAIRLNFPNMANNPDAAAIGSLTTEQLDSVKKLIIDRLNIIKPSARADAEEEIDRFIDWWKLQAAQTKPLRYYVVGTERYNRLMNPYDQPHDENEKATLRSMREVESSANMFYYTED